MELFIKIHFLLLELFLWERQELARLLLLTHILRILKMHFIKNREVVVLYFPSLTTTPMVQ